MGAVSLGFLVYRYCYSIVVSLFSLRRRQIEISDSIARDDFSRAFCRG
jgi:hypothetical protein